MKSNKHLKSLKIKSESSQEMAEPLLDPFFCRRPTNLEDAATQPQLLLHLGKEQWKKEEQSLPLWRKGEERLAPVKERRTEACPGPSWVGMFQLQTIDLFYVLELV